MDMNLILNDPGLMTLFGFIVLWELVWKGIALWRCARQDEQVWFVFILFFNTVGILPIIFLYFFDEDYGLLKKKKIKVRSSHKKKVKSK